MSENLKLWNILGRTDPAHVKKFKRAGGFSGSAIKPMWSFKRMTEEFGPCGIGWGVGEPSFQVVSGPEGEMLVYCTASVWFKQGEELSQTVYGVGGDKVVSYYPANTQYNKPERRQSDDEAFKKAYTDAVTNALKLIGVGADVHMGLFDDNKYIAEMEREFADEPEPQAGPPRKANGKPEAGWREDGTRTSYALKNEGSWEEVKAELDADAVDCDTLNKLEALKNIYREKARERHWNKSFLEALMDEFNAIERTIMEAMDNAELAEVGLDKTLRQSIANHPLNAG